jgi:hypothetical protein
MLVFIHLLFGFDRVFTRLQLTTGRLRAQMKRLDNPLIEHCIRDFDESGNVRAHYKIA